MGCIFAPAFSTATLGVERQEAGIASAMVNTSQQVGGSVGTALLSTLFAGAAAWLCRSHTARQVWPAARMIRLPDSVLVGGRNLRRRAAGCGDDPAGQDPD